MSGDWIRLYRKVLESQVFANAELLKLWMLCLLRANYRDRFVPVEGRTSPVLVRRGQFLTGRYALHREFYPKPSGSDKAALTVWRWLESLRDMGCVNIETNNRFSLVTVVNYEVYQSGDSEDEQQNEQQMNSRRTQEKKVKKDKNLSSSRPKLRFDEEDMGVARWMFDRIRELQPSRKEPDFEKWAHTLRLMREQDGRTHEDIRDLFERANRDSFWQTNILCPEKLREKWDDLDLKLRRRSDGRETGGSGRRGSTVRRDSPARVHQRNYE